MRRVSSNLVLLGLVLGFLVFLAGSALFRLLVRPAEPRVREIQEIVADLHNKLEAWSLTAYSIKGLPAWCVAALGILAAGLTVRWAQQRSRSSRS